MEMNKSVKTRFGVDVDLKSYVPGRIPRIVALVTLILLVPL